MNTNNTIELIFSDLQKQLDYLKKLYLSGNTEYYMPSTIELVDIRTGSIEEKINRIVEQITQYNINILPTSDKSQWVRSAIVAELGENGLKYWLKIRKLRNNYDEATQIKRYNYLLTNRDKIPLTFGTIVNRYKEAIEKYNENNLNKMNKNGEYKAKCYEKW